jgi:hypothetical protein
MTIDISGCDRKLASASILISIEENHPLIMLGNALPWSALAEIVLPDLKRTTAKGCWFMGRKLLVRVHLAAYTLQKIYNLTDRQVEYFIKDNAAYQLFSGKNIVRGWRTIDHTKIEKFRSRLSPETQRILANEIARIAVALGMADARETDLDSTVQEANIAYPADAGLITKLAGIGKKVVDYLKEKTCILGSKGVTVDLKKIKEKARGYFFLSKNTAIETRRRVFKKFHQVVKQQMRPVIELCSSLKPSQIASLPWNIRRAIQQINVDGLRYLLDVGFFIRTHAIKAGKALSFHASQIACIKKGKAGKEFEFGRVFQLGRIKGNFLFVLESTSVRMEDKYSLVPMLEEHAVLFGEGTLASVSTDKGYWSAKNLRHLDRPGVKEKGLQHPANIKNKKHLPPPEVQERLRRRRAGIEPLIGRTKHGGQLGRSRMKSDAATLAAGYSSVFGFNLRQLSRHQTEKMARAA